MFTAKLLIRKTADGSFELTNHLLTFGDKQNFATNAESLAISAYGVKRLLNHSVDQNDVPSNYIVIDVERLRKLMQLIEDFILATAKERNPEIAVCNPQFITKKGDSSMTQQSIRHRLSCLTMRPILLLLPVVAASYVLICSRFGAN